MNHSVLIVDDDPMFLKFVEYALRQRCFKVYKMQAGSFVIDAVRDKQPDIVLLDRILPDASGFEICEDLKMRFPDLPVIMLSSKGESQDVIEGIYLGADDYLPKPFSPEFLVAKIHAVLRRRARPDPPEEAAFGCFQLDPSSEAVLVDGDPLELTKTERAILSELILRRGSVLKTNHILVRILGYAPDQSHMKSNIAFHIAGLRKKLGPRAAALKTIRGVGYRLDAGAQRDSES